MDGAGVPRSGVSGTEVIEKEPEFVAHLGAGHDVINEAVLLEELGGLESLRQGLVGGFANDAGSGESDHGTGFRDDDVAEGGVAGHDAGGGRVCEDGNVGEAGGGEVGEGAGGFGHLHEAEHAFIHAGTA